MKKIKYIYIVLLTINILSCSNCSIQDKLEDINKYVCTNPDSAIKELDKIKESQLKTKELCAHHALLKVKSEYLTKRTINDSTLNVAYNFFIKNDYGTTSQKRETMLFCLYKKIYTCPSEALPQLLEMEKQIDELSSPHFKGILESFILIIYYNNHEYSEMLKHAFKELKYAKEGKNISKIINSKFHIGIAYKNMNMVDSALYYYS